jgi:site-specific recombinase XerD
MVVYDIAVCLADAKGTALMRGGANLEAVRELGGHSKLHTTQRYVHATGADLRDGGFRVTSGK